MQTVGIGRFVHAIDQRQLAFPRYARHGLVRRQHERFNQLFRFAAIRAI